MFGLQLLLFVIALVTGCAPRPTASGPMPQEIYVWQRVWDPPVVAALTQAREKAAGFSVLVVETDVRDSEAKSFRPNVDYAALKASGVPIALVIRIDPFAGPFAEQDRRAQTIVRLAQDAVKSAHDAGIDPEELQIDFDCGEAKLGGYHKWLKAIRAAVSPLPVTPTMLPSWLNRSEFRTLARESGGFILQVHSVEMPENVGDTAKLTDSARAAGWVEQASRIGVPFRVSLPSYSYVVAFDRAGKFAGLSAEGPSARWPPDARVVRWEALPAEMAQLVAQWTRKRPALLRGLCWYRLPVASDHLNWSWKTLAAAMEGRAPQSALRVIGSESQPSEIVVINDGEMDERLPQAIEARFGDAKLIAADALGGYELRRREDSNTLAFHLTAMGEVLRLPPGTRHNVGWIRSEPSTPLQLSVLADSSPLPARSATAGARDWF